MRAVVGDRRNLDAEIEATNLYDRVLLKGELFDISCEGAVTAEDIARVLGAETYEVRTTAPLFPPYIEESNEGT